MYSPGFLRSSRSRWERIHQSQFLISRIWRSVPSTDEVVTITRDHFILLLSLIVQFTWMLTALRNQTFSKALCTRRRGCLSSRQRERSVNDLVPDVTSTLHRVVYWNYLRFVLVRNLCCLHDLVWRVKTRLGSPNYDTEVRVPQWTETENRVIWADQLNAQSRFDAARNLWFHGGCGR